VFKKDVVSDAEKMVKEEKIFSTKDMCKLMRAGLSFKQVQEQMKKIKSDMEIARQEAEARGEEFSEKEFLSQILRNAQK